MDDLEARIKAASAQIMKERKGLYDMFAADDEDRIKMINDRAEESSARVKLIADRDVIEFLNPDGLLGKISVAPLDQLVDQEQKIAALEHVELLFIVADEDDMKPIAAIVDKARMDRFYEKPLEPQYQNVDVKLLIVLLREKFELHVKHYLFRDADTVTVIPYHHNQDAVIHALLRSITDAFNRDRERLIEFLKSSQYFVYDIDGQSNSALQYAGDRLELDGVTLETPHPIDLETKFSVKVLGVGKKHYVGKMPEYIAYEDLDDINTPSEIKRVVDDIDAQCLIIEFDDAHFAPAEEIAKVRYSRPFVVFIPTETFVESEWANVTIKVRAEDREALVRHINQFEIGREDFFDPIGFDMKTATFKIITPDELDALDAQLANVKQIYCSISNEKKTDEIHRRIEEKLPTDCRIDCSYSYGDAPTEITLYMSEYALTGEPRWYE